LKYQRFDNTFFNLIKLFNDTKGAFDQSDLLNHVMQYGSSSSRMATTNDLDSMKLLYNLNERGGYSFYNSTVNRYGLIFRTFLTTLEFIHEFPDIEDSDRQMHLKVFFGQLSISECQLLLYHFVLGVTPDRFEEYKYLLFEPLRYSNQMYTPHLQTLGVLRPPVMPK
jgi:hypothetical protein